MNGLADMSGRVKSLGFKIMLAAVSGLCCGMVWQSELSDLAPGYFVCAALFAAGVLFPYVRYGKSAWLVVPGLIVLATFSFSCANEAVWIARGDSYVPVTTGFLAASLVGAFIVLAGARFIIPLHRSFELVVAGFLAAIIGGIVFVLLDDSAFYFAFATWHSLMAVAIHLAENWPLRIA